MSGRVLITGASGALGRSVVARFLEAGDRVLAVGATQAALAELSALGATDALTLRRVDLSSTPQGEQLFAGEEAGAGGPPAGVHLVGGLRWGGLVGLSGAGS